MPSVTGESQTSEEYAPHLYYKGQYVGEEEAKKLRECDRIARKENIDALLKATGVDCAHFDYDSKKYDFEKQGDSWQIQKQRVVVGVLHRGGYVEVRYGVNFNVHEPAALRQIELAKELCDKLKDAGCNSLVEIPPQAVVKSELEKLMQYTQRVYEMFK